MSPSTGKSKITRVVLVVALLVVLALLYAFCGIDRTDEPMQSTAVETPPEADAVRPPAEIAMSPQTPSQVAPPPLPDAPLLAEPTDGNRMTVRLPPAEAGLPDTVSSFEIVHDDEAPRLDVAYPESPIDNDTFLLAGSTEPGALVFHNDQQITTTETGEFELWVTLKRGVNVVTIEAIDPAGNVAYQTRMVSADY